MRKVILFLMALSLPVSVEAKVSKLAYYTGTKSDASLRTNASKITTLAPDTYAIDTKGALTGSIPSNVTSVISANGIALYPVISNFGTTDFDPAIAHAVLKTGTAQTNAIANMVALSQKNGAAGVNLDFEAVTNTDRSLLSAFVKKLADALHAKSRRLIVSVPAATSDDPNSSWTGAFDYAAIGSSADLVQVMTYDQNGPWDVDGPVAGLNWVKSTISFAESRMPKSKISMGVAAYGYDWNLTDSTGSQVDWKDIPALITATGATPTWDSASSSPKFYYSVGGKEHVVWYENAQSIKLKAQYAVAENVASVSIWSLGQEDGSFWSALSSGGL